MKGTTMVAEHSACSVLNSNSWSESDVTVVVWGLG